MEIQRSPPLQPAYYITCVILLRWSNPSDLYSAKTGFIVGKTLTLSHVKTLSSQSRGTKFRALFPALTNGTDDPLKALRKSQICRLIPKYCHNGCLCYAP